MTSENERCAERPHNKLHKKLHKSCSIPVLSDLNEVKQAIFRYLYDYPMTTAANIARDLTKDIRGWSIRNINDHILNLKNRWFIEETTETKPFPLKLTFFGRRVVQLDSAGVTDRTWVRLEKTFIEFTLSEISPGDLDTFREKILESGKWGYVSKTTNNNWLKLIIKSRFPFFRGGTLEFRFGKIPKFRVYLTENAGSTPEEAQYRAYYQAVHLNNQFRVQFFHHGIELEDDVFSWEGLNERGSLPEFESPAPIDLGKRVKVQTEDDDLWIDESKGFAEWGSRDIHQATRLFTIPNQLDELKDELVHLRAENYRILKENSELKEQNTALEQKIDRILALLEK
ncbi:MAG: hypothetical protein GF308_02375 [Candidatus Heimdallarchaeota archaeon]|nr:hypothetical protein [Candidatus Heimdallarchaeota archaeon]